MEICDGMKEDRQYKLPIEVDRDRKLAGRQDIRLPLQEAVERIVAGFDPLKIVLFGSLARGEYRVDSVVDLLVVIPDGSDDGGSGKHEVTVEILRALKDLPFPKDVVVSTPEEIVRRGDLVGTVLRPALLRRIRRKGRWEGRRQGKGGT